MKESDDYCSALDPKDCNLPDQSTMCSGSPPSETRMQKMINDRYSTDLSPTAGMKSSKSSGIPSSGE